MVTQAGVTSHLSKANRKGWIIVSVHGGTPHFFEVKEFDEPAPMTGLDYYDPYGPIRNKIHQAKRQFQSTGSSRARWYWQTQRALSFNSVTLGQFWGQC